MGTEFITKHVKAFFRESTGRFFAMAVIGIVSLFFAGGIAPDLLLLNLILAMISTFAFTVFVLLTLYNRSSNKLQIQIDVLSDKYGIMEETLTGKISLLEHYTPYAIAEIVLPDLVFVHSNTNWLSVTGWKITELNKILLDVKIEQRTELLVTLLYEKDSQEIIKNILYGRISGDTTAKRVKNISLRHKNGEEKPITLQTHLIKKEGSRSLYQLFISDESIIKDLIDSIELQNNTFKGMLAKFSHIHNEKDEANKFLQEMQKVTKEALKKTGTFNINE